MTRNRPISLMRRRKRDADLQTAGLDGVRLVPGDRILLLAIPLPPLPAARRRDAARFAAEAHLAQPLDRQRVILCDEMDAIADAPSRTKTYLICVIDDALVAEIEATLPQAHRMVPEPLMLPRPAPGHWLACGHEGRVVVRVADGTGFSAQPSLVPLLWHHAGRPVLDWCGPVAPDPALAVGGVVFGQVHTAPMPPDPVCAVVDLSANTQSLRRQALVRLWVGGAVVAAVAAHVGLAFWGIAQTQARADQIAAQVQTMLDDRGLSSGQSVEATVTALMSRSRTGPDQGFVATLQTVAAALQDVAGTVTLADLGYDRAENILTAGLIAPDIQAVQAAVELLTAAGLSVQSGTANVSDGVARLAVTIIGGPGE